MQLVPSLHSTAGTITGNGTERQLRYDDWLSIPKNRSAYFLKDLKALQSS
jgi:hypothetical protein